MSNLLIGLSGMPRAGKDTVAVLLEKEFPGIHKVNFSKAITEEYDALHGTSTRHDEEEKIQHRAGIATLANKRRDEDPHYWNKRTLHHHDAGDLLVAGVRAVAEAEAVKQRGGILIRVEVSEKTLRERWGEHMDKPEHHVAEHHLKDFHDWDYVIHNDGTLEELEKKVKDIAKKIKKLLLSDK